ncbi:hypothetical protein KI688_007434 [Linnemannia hyalina]|uniref:Myb-like domain-containing protein n=1 Tax=Linnemannia hyalina TaxID=64524 RepID=A0A9P7XJ41_9FUNG|nr:hypothetical protein KI688_007434 [Linnemannia hyalina]
MLAADNASTPQEEQPTVDSPSTNGPLNTINLSLKRIRLNEETSTSHQLNASRTDSIEQEWGPLDLTELDDSELAGEAEIQSPSSKKARKESDENIDPEQDDMDDFVSAGLPKASSSAGEPSTDRRPTAFTSASILSHKKQTSKKSSSGKGPKPTRTVNGMEDVFSHTQVRTWSEVRIKTWEHRRTNVEGFYYRFVDPTEGQQNGPWSVKSTQEFMVRLEEWKARGIRIGTSWGIFSMKVSNKAGYQCSSYYRKLLETKKLTDPAYAWEGGKLIMVNKSVGGEMAVSGLSERWDTDEVREIEANINHWIKEYHSNPAGRPVATKAKRIDSGSSIISALTTNSNSSTTTTTATSRFSSITTTTSRSSTSAHFRPTIEAPRVKATTAPALPKALSLRPGKQPIDESEMIPVVDINDKLAEYSSFMKKTSTTVTATPKVRQPISLTVAGTATSSSSSKPPARAIVPIEVRKTPITTSNVKGQTGLSLFWKNIKPVRVECPDVPKIMIPKDVEQRPTWAHRVQPVADPDATEVEGSTYMEIKDMHAFDWSSISEGFDEPVNDIQGVLADPPWNFIVEDGRNDGACRLTMPKFGEIMEKALEFMPNGIVSVWTHKAILPEVVSIMHGLGCRYVENLVWYKTALNNSDLNRASPYFRTTKEILLMFKKGDGFDIRHQRTADVIMDFEKPTSAWINDDYTEPKPDSVFEMMEILLPDARYIPTAGRGRLLEIWAKKSQERRTGWISVHELKTIREEEETIISTTTVDAGDVAAASGAVSSEAPDPSLTTAMPVEDDIDDGSSLDEAILAEIANDMDLDM